MFRNPASKGGGRNPPFFYMKKLLIKNPDGNETWFHSDGDKFHIESRQDVSAILERNRVLRNEFSGYKDRNGVQYHKYATIPAVVIDKWRNEKGIDIFNPDHAEAVKKLLNDPDWRYLRTTEGTI